MNLKFQFNQHLKSQSPTICKQSLNSMIFMQFLKIEFQSIPLRLSFQFQICPFPISFCLLTSISCFSSFSNSMYTSIEWDTKWGNWILKQYYIIISMQSNAGVVGKSKIGKVFFLPSHQHLICNFGIGNGKIWYQNVSSFSVSFPFLEKRFTVVVQLEWDEVNMSLRNEPHHRNC